MILPKSQIAKITNKKETIIRKNQTKATINGKSKTPTPTKTTVAIRKTKPTKNALTLSTSL